MNKHRTNTNNLKNKTVVNENEPLGEPLYKKSSSCLLSPSTSSSSHFLQTLCKETSKIKDQQELKTLSEKEDSVGERRLCRRKKTRSEKEDSVGKRRLGRRKKTRSEKEDSVGERHGDDIQTNMPGLIKPEVIYLFFAVFLLNLFYVFSSIFFGMISNRLWWFFFFLWWYIYVYVLLESL